MEFQICCYLHFNLEEEEFRRISTFTGNGIPINPMPFVSIPLHWNYYWFIPSGFLIFISHPTTTIGIELTSNCWFLELKEFVPDKSDDKTRFSDSCVSEKN